MNTQKNIFQIIRNILAIVAGCLIGGWVNMSLINISGKVIPLPEGAITNTAEGLKASIHLFEPKHFIFPFLAHALGSFVGAVVAYLTAATHRFGYAVSIGVFFLVGGIYAVYLFPAPLWFDIADLGLAYIPMGYLGGKLAEKFNPNS